MIACEEWNLFKIDESIQSEQPMIQDFIVYNLKKEEI